MNLQTRNEDPDQNAHEGRCDNGAQICPKGPFTLCTGCDIEISNQRSHLLSLSTVKFCFKSKEILFIERMITIQGGYLIFYT